MHNNYHFFQYLIPALQNKLTGKYLVECFSQNKDELILGFANDHQGFYIKAALGSQFSCLSFLENFARAKKNSVNLFEELTNKKVEGLKLYENERCFSILFEQEFELLFKLHGNRSNLLLFENQSLFKLFKNSLQKDVSIQLKHLNREIDQSYQAFTQVDQSVVKLFPTWGKIPKAYLKEKGFFQLSSADQQWGLIQEVSNELDRATFYITKYDGNLCLSMLEIGEVLQKSNDPLEAMTSFYHTYIKENSLELEQGKAILQIEKKIKSTENYISQNSRKLQELQSGLSYSQVADLIMANMHHIEEGKRQATLSSFYDDGKTITISLNKELSPQKNAERYYRKSKNQEIEIRKIEQNINDKEEVLHQLKSQLIQIKEIQEVKELRKYIKDSNINTTKAKEEKKLFKKFKVDGFDVWVGKSAANNDLLTLKYAKKDDLWFHAKDVSGSHTVLKAQAGKTITNHTKEKVAIIAAYYSKRKSDSLCPVIVTPKKFVRKPKGFPPGRVVVDKEEVILVNPSEFKNLSF